MNVMNTNGGSKKIGEGEGEESSAASFIGTCNMCRSKGANNLPDLLDFDNSLLQCRINRSYDGEEGRQANQGACHHRGRRFGKNEACCKQAGATRKVLRREAESHGNLGPNENRHFLAPGNDAVLVSLRHIQLQTTVAS